MVNKHTVLFIVNCLEKLDQWGVNCFDVQQLCIAVDWKPPAVWVQNVTRGSQCRRAIHGQFVDFLDQFTLCRAFLMAIRGNALFAFECHFATERLRFRQKCSVRYFLGQYRRRSWSKFSGSAVPRLIKSLRQPTTLWTQIFSATICWLLVSIVISLKETRDFTL